MAKKYYTANDSTFVDGINKIIHLKDRMGCCCTRPPLQPNVVFSSYVDRIYSNLKLDIILCPHCFAGLNYLNFKDIDYDECESKSDNNQKKRLETLNK